MLCHKRLGHISRERVERLIKNDILPSLDFEDMEICVDCIRGKLSKAKNKGASRSSDLLEIVHTDISGLIPLLYVALGIFSLSLMIFLIIVIFI